MRAKTKTAAATRMSFSDTMMSVSLNKDQQLLFFKGSHLEKGNINQVDKVQDRSGRQTIPLFPIFWNEKQESKNVL